MKKGFDDGTQMIRISGRCKLTQQAIETIDNADNKSAFYAEAINFYVAFGKNINERLNSIDEKLDSIKHLKVVIDSPDVVPSIVRQSENDTEKMNEKISETEEERIEREKINYLADSFMGGLFDEGGE